MMRKSYMPQRLELLQVGEEMGWPRMGWMSGKAIREGERYWEAFAGSANHSMLNSALRRAKFRKEYFAWAAEQVAKPIIPDDRKERMRANLEKARAIRAAKKAERDAAQVVA